MYGSVKSGVGLKNIRNKPTKKSLFKITQMLQMSLHPPKNIDNSLIDIIFFTINHINSISKGNPNNWMLNSFKKIFLKYQILCS